MSRRAVGRVVLLLVGLLAVVAVVVVVVTGRADEGPQPPPVELGLLPWLPRGELKADLLLAELAGDVWRGGRLVDGGSAPVPAEETYVLWAGTIGLGRVVVLEGVAADGTPLVAQVAEHDDPAVLQLDAVAALPPGGDVPVLAVTYDGNLDIPGLSAGEGADLIQVLQEPAPGAARAIWEQDSESMGNDLEVLDEYDEGMTETFLYLGFEGDPPSALVVGEVGVHARVVATVDVLPRQLVSPRAAIELVDGQPWGPSGRIDGGEYADALAVAAAIGVDAATVSEVVAETSSGPGVDIVARLLQVRTDSGARFLAVTARDPAGDLACLSIDGPLSTGPLSSHPLSTDPPSTGPPARAALDDRLIARQCVDVDRSLRVIAVAAAPGEGAVRLTASAGPTGSADTPSGEAVARLIEVGPYSSAQRVDRVASLVDHADVHVTLAPPSAP